MTSIARFVVERSPDQVRLAFHSVIEICKTKNIANVTLVVPQKAGFDRTIVAEFLGPSVVKKLLKGQSVLVTQGVQMTLESAQTFSTNGSDGLLIGAHISGRDMNKLDDSIGAQAIVYLPWNDIEGTNWRADWGAQILGSTTLPSLTVNLSSAVEEALRNLTQAINLGTGLNHPSDRKHAERTIALLQRDGHQVDPVEVYRWARRNGWSSSAASELEEIVSRAK